MSRIRIKNFGPIKEGLIENDGWLDIKKVTVFIGNQGSGKSTVAKLISSLTWMEKTLNRTGGPLNLGSLVISNYHRINNYFSERTEIEYEGEVINGVLINKATPTFKNNFNQVNNYRVPKIMYVPAERNFLSVIKNPYSINLPDSLQTFAKELINGQIKLNEKKIELPIGGINYRYDSKKDTSFIIGEDYELDLTEASSGYQSFIPLYLVTKFLTDELQKEEDVLREQLSAEQSVRRNKEINDILFNASLSETEKNEKVKQIDAKYLNTCLINIVEEPEQNLFPSSQREVLNSLLGFNNMNEGNKLILTTHSPYIINYLTLAVKAHTLKTKTNNSGLRQKLNEIVPLESTVNPNDLVIYELDERNGTIKKLEGYNGLPSDENYLNEQLGESNELFAQLLEIQQGL